MNVYDFDKTIFYPDSSAAFVLFCLKKRPLIFLRELPSVLKELYLWTKGGKKDAKPLKEAVFSFLPLAGDADSLVAAFWEENISGIRPWYLEKRKPDDLIISASPDFLLRPVANRLGFSLIATEYSLETGKIKGENNYGKQKPVRFRELCPNGVIDEFYSDSLSDAPLAALSKKAFLVNKDAISPWPE